MKFDGILKTSITIIALLFSTGLMAQCDTIASICEKHISKDFISDGQSYRALIHDNEVAEFHTTFFGGSTYRIAACSGLKDGNLIFRVYDKNRNLIFTNKDYGNSPYWNFEVPSTTNCIIEATLDPTKASSGCAVLLIGFQE